MSGPPIRFQAPALPGPLVKERVAVSAAYRGTEVGHRELDRAWAVVARASGHAELDIGEAATLADALLAFAGASTRGSLARDTARQYAVLLQRLAREARENEPKLPDGAI